MPSQTRIANVYEFLHGGEPYWGNDFKDLFSAAYRAAWNDTYASDQIFQGEEEVLSLWDKETPIGLAIFSKEWEGNKPYVMMLFVKDSERRKGVGTALVQALAEHVKCSVQDILGEATTQEGAEFARARLVHIPISYTEEIDI